MKGAAAVANILKRQGAEYLFCFPANPIIDACAEVGIKPIMARTERTAVAIADGYVRMANGGKLATVAVQLGPGVENSFGGIAQAFSDSSPILFLPGGPDQRRLGQEPNFDPVVSYREITKWAARINDVGRVPELMRRAFTYMQTGRPGPVLLELPSDVAGADLDETLLPTRPVAVARSLAEPAQVAAAVTALLAAKQPLLHAGHGVFYAGAAGELRELAELLQAPVMTTLPAKSVFPEDHPLALGCGGHSGTEMAGHYLQVSDLVFGIGASFTISPFAAPIPPGKTAIQLTVDERDLNKDYPVDFPLLGDARLVLRQVIDEVKRQRSAAAARNGETAAAVKQMRQQMLDRWLPKLTSDEVPMNPYRVVWELMHAVDRQQTTITHDAGTPRDMLAPFWTTVSPRGYIGWGKSSHLGYGLGLAIGAKLAAPERMVINLMGDAAFGMIGLDVETAVRNRIPTLTVLLNNSCLGNYGKALKVSTERYGTRYISGDYTLIAKGLGAYSERVERPEEIRPALERARKAMAAGQPALLEMMTREETELSQPW